MKHAPRLELIIDLLNQVSAYRLNASCIGGAFAHPATAPSHCMIPSRHPATAALPLESSDLGASADAIGRMKVWKTYLILLITRLHCVLAEGIFLFTTCIIAF